MMSFDHPNVMKLRGICLDGGPAPYIIMPFMPNGSLLAFLKDNRSSVFIDSNSAASCDAVRLMATQELPAEISKHCWFSD